jgi:hypothetical protein
MSLPLITPPLIFAARPLRCFDRLRRFHSRHASPLPLAFIFAIIHFRYFYIFSFIAMIFSLTAAVFSLRRLSYHCHCRFHAFTPLAAAFAAGFSATPFDFRFDAAAFRR